MNNEIKRLEESSYLLEPDMETRSGLLQRVIAYTDDFLERLPELPAYCDKPNDDRLLYGSPIGEEPSDIDELLAIIGHDIDSVGINPASPRMLGYIPGGGLFHSALGDYLAAITNRYAGHFFASPGAVRIENILIHWMADVVGYPESAEGNLTSGGSLANLTAIVVARDALNIVGRRIERSVIYLTEHTHHSVDKSLHVAGLGNCIRRKIAVDDVYRMDTQMLAQAVETDRAVGLNPWLVVATAGTTNSGSVDPLIQIGNIAGDNDLWFHVDGAYGAFFALCDEGRSILGGMDQSDSIIMDPHKSLFLPYGTGAVLVRDGRELYESFSWQADYAQDVPDNPEELSPSELSPELTKHFRGLRLWLPLKLAGVASFRAALSEKILLARYFYAKLSEMEGFEVGPYPDLSIVTYRYVPRRGDHDEFNRRLVAELQHDGRVLISSTRLNGNFVLRMAAMSFRTHLNEIDETLEILRYFADRLRKDM